MPRLERIGWADVRANLPLMSYRRRRQLAMWVMGPHWLPSLEELQAYRTSTRGQARNLRTGASTEVNQVSGEILVA